ncbi:MAG: hypothetical protein CME36_06710 [unclassified Hahellaceae]|nr:hypothetical protein [Hahellaceae bacterium]
MTADEATNGRAAGVHQARQGRAVLAADVEGDAGVYAARVGGLGIQEVAYYECFCGEFQTAFVDECAIVCD